MPTSWRSVKARGTNTFQVGGRAGVPATHLTAVTLDVTAVNPAKSGALTVFPAKRARPSAQMVDFKAGQSMTGLVTVPVVGGKVSVYNGGAGGAILARAADRLGALFNATVLELNVTVLGAKSPGALEAFEDGPLYEDGVTLPNSTSLPGTSSLAFSPGQPQSSLVIVPAGSFVDFYNGSNASIGVLADVEGYYTNP